MIAACRDKLEEWGAFAADYNIPVPEDAVMSWALEAAFRAAGYVVQNPLGPEIEA